MKKVLLEIQNLIFIVLMPTSFIGTYLMLIDNPLYHKFFDAALIISVLWFCLLVFAGLIYLNEDY